MKDIHQSMTDRILASLDEAGNWSPPWRGSGSPLPRNAVTGKRYHGVNVLSCWLSGYDSQRWASYRQWESIGAQVRKGEKGTPIIFYKVISGAEPADDKLVLRSSFVFNAEQVEGAPAEAVPAPAETNTRIERIEAWLAERPALKPAVDPDGRAYYRPSTDSIHLPAFASFHTAEHFYSVLFHEATHWTGAKHRLDRIGTYQGEARAREELVAELGAAFLAAEFGIENVTRDDHRDYLATWLKALKNDKRCITTAASEASKAIAFLDAMVAQDERLAA